MKVLLTGGSGFLGSHIADALTEAGHEVVLFDIKPSPWRRDDQKQIVSSVLDTAAVADAIKGVDVIYHLAAIADIKEANLDPRRAIDVNLNGTVNMLESARAAKIKRFVFASTIYVYSDQGGVYRTTKRACEHLIEDYQRQFGLEFTVLRFGSLYGPRADESNGLRRLLTQALKEKRIDHFGTGEEIREYIHVLDAAAMSLDILKPEFANQYVHLSGRERLSSRDMLTMIREILGGDVELTFGGNRLPGHYLQTPYNYTPKLGRRLVRDTYIDFGLGLLDCLRDLDANAESGSATTKNKIKK